ncbi:MAG: stress protein [Epulopiscium sp. Nele67-Bin004]|nr:MAG: stress protein [Epulopiscium sp. Nele67-Bin004]
MAISLKKGDKVKLTKADGKALKNVTVGLGWDMAKKKSLLGAIDCDASIFVLQNGKLQSDNDIICYARKEHKSKTILHTGDNLTGRGEGDDEQIKIRLQDVPAEYDSIVFIVTIFMAKVKKQDFGMIQNAFIRIVDNSDDTEIMRYDLTENYAGKTAMIFGELTRQDDGEWKFNAIGEGTDDGSISKLSKRYK